MVSRACRGAPSDKEMVSRACRGAPSDKEMVSRACRGAPSDKEIVSRACRGAPSYVPPMFYCYILLCSDSSYYVGVTDNLDQRVQRHNQGTASDWTSRRRPVSLVWSEEHPTLSSARMRENQLKRWSHMSKRPLWSEVPLDCAQNKARRACSPDPFLSRPASLNEIPPSLSRPSRRTNSIPPFNFSPHPPAISPTASPTTTPENPATQKLSSPGICSSTPHFPANR